MGRVPFTKVGNGALGAQGLSCPTDVASVQDEPVMRVLPELTGYIFEQGPFHFKRGCSGGESRAVCHPENMRVHGNGGFTEGGVEHHVGCFSSHTG